MTKKELLKKESQLFSTYEDQIHKLRYDYAIENAKFEVGDLVKTITGIFKVTQISYGIYNREIEIVYCGNKYHMNNDGKLIISDKNTACFTNGIKFKS